MSEKDKGPLLCYKTIMEYASMIWGPLTEDNIRKLVQRRAAPMIYADCRLKSIMMTMLQQLQWSTPQEPRAQPKVVMVYRIIYNLPDIQIGQLIPTTVIFLT